MGASPKTTDFLKECMADALLQLMLKKDFARITVNEIADAAGVNRSTWFRNFANKNEAITFKLVRMWYRWADEHGIKEHHRYTIENAGVFFAFNYSIKDILDVIHRAELQSCIYEAFYEVMMPQYGTNAFECYESRFFSYALFGLLDEWIKRGFYESVEQMAENVKKICNIKTLENL